MNEPAKFLYRVIPFGGIVLCENWGIAQPWESKSDAEQFLTSVRESDWIKLPEFAKDAQILTRTSIHRGDIERAVNQSWQTPYENKQAEKREREALERSVIFQQRWTDPPPKKVVRRAIKKVVKRAPGNVSSCAKT